jgi:hypothetical protein
MKPWLPLTFAGLLGLIATQWFDWPDRHREALRVTPTASESEGPGVEPSEPPLLSTSASDYDEIYEHSLFRVDRKGFHTEPQTDTPAMGHLKPPGFRLLGVILSKSEPPAAMILEPQKTKSRLIHVGDQVGAWELKAITADHVVMTARDQRQSVPLRPY